MRQEYQVSLQGKDLSKVTREQGGNICENYLIWIINL